MISEIVKINLNWCSYLYRVALCAGFLFFLSRSAKAADPPDSSAEDPENFHIELTGAAWLVNSGGTIQAGSPALEAFFAVPSTPIDLVSDLGVSQQRPTFYGKLVIKPARRHRLVVEGMPVRLQGTNNLTRTVVYQGQTFTVGQTLKSSADLNYLFAGYQFDVLSRSTGHLGFSVGGAYLNATGTIRGVQSGLVATKSETLGLPLAGAEFRVFLIPHRKLLELDGGVRGMAFGGYGHYVEGGASAGVDVGPVTFQAGYRAVSPDLHSTSNGGNGVDVRLRGPIFSVQWRW